MAREVLRSTAMSLVADVRFALRMMVKHLGVTAVLVLTLGLGDWGVDANDFSVVDSVVIKSLPYPDSDRLVRLYSEFLSESGQGSLHKFWLSAPEYNEYAKQCASCASVAVYVPRFASIGGGERPVRVPTAYVWRRYGPRSVSRRSSGARSEPTRTSRAIPRRS